MASKLISGSRQQQQAREVLTNFFIDKFPEILCRWDELTPSEQWNAVIRILPYIAPKLSAVTVSASGPSAVSTLIELMNQAK